MILPPATIGIVGGGQLGQMISQAAVSLGYTALVLDPTPNCPASRVAEQIVAPYGDAAAVAELFARSDVVTYEFENVDATRLEEANSAAKEERLPQGVECLRICQDREAEKLFLTRAGAPIAPFRIIGGAQMLERAASELGYPCVLKTTRGGYDGKGQVVIRGPADLAAAAELARSVPCVLERWIPFEKEISAIVAGNGTGSFQVFPASENQHRANILHRSTTPAQLPESTESEAYSLAKSIARNLDLRGVMGVEMFVLEDGELLVNELAPRPHNSGHYTIEACDYSQFEAHVRGICGLPLSPPRLLSPAVMTNILGEDLEAALADLAATQGSSYHFYGKAEAAPGRKMGHVVTLEPRQG